MRRKVFRWIIFSLAFIVLSCGLLWYVLSMNVSMIASAVDGSGPAVTQSGAYSEHPGLHVPQNTTIRAAVDSVHAHVGLPTPQIVSLAARVVARITGRTVQSGWYIFTSADTQLDVLMALFSGHRRVTVRVTIPEGLTYREIAGILSRTVDTDTTLFIAWCDSLKMEGFLMPETYDFFWREDAIVIGERLNAEWRRRTRSLNPSKDHVILASIVQAEAVQSKEMPTIAGVYTNRLARGMRLEADPTVQYGLGEKRRLLYRDLDDNNPWNTYVITGLPPTPINNPGVSAIKAAMSPATHSFLFFVAKGDSSGEHLFSKTGSEHLRNVRTFRRNRRIEE